MLYSGSQTLFGNRLRETLFRVCLPRHGRRRETEFRGWRSQTEFGNEEVSGNFFGTPLANLCFASACHSLEGGAKRSPSITQCDNGSLRLPRKKIISRLSAFGRRFRAGECPVVRLHTKSGNEKELFSFPFSSFTVLDTVIWALIR